MKYFALVLHFYQPPTQNLATTQAILETCYLPLLKMLSKKEGIGITLNISGSLLEQLEILKADSFFELVTELVKAGTVELVNSAMYHTLLPIAPNSVWQRQTQQNKETIERCFGTQQLNGFFPPELAVDEAHFPQISDKYVFVHESSANHTSIAKFQGIPLLVGNRELIEICRSYPGLLNAKLFVEYALNKFPDEELIVLPNDAELFGHHYVERLQFLSDLLDSNEIAFLTGSQAVARFEKKAEVIDSLQLSSWQNVAQLDLWLKNKLQKKYLDLAYFFTDLVSKSPNSEANHYLDQGWSSCYLYWLSNWPWWHPDLVSGGALCLIRSVRASEASFEMKIEAEKMYASLMLDIWEYHWSEKVKEGYRHYDQKRDQLLTTLPELS